MPGLAQYALEGSVGSWWPPKEGGADNPPNAIRMTPQRVRLPSRLALLLSRCCLQGMLFPDYNVSRSVGNDVIIWNRCPFRVSHYQVLPWLMVSHRCQSGNNDVECVKHDCENKDDTKQLKLLLVLLMSWPRSASSLTTYTFLFKVAVRVMASFFSASLFLPEFPFSQRP